MVMTFTSSIQESLFNSFASLAKLVIYWGFVQLPHLTKVAQ
jgi:hypothetical protein